MAGSLGQKPHGCFSGVFILPPRGKNWSILSYFSRFWTITLEHFDDGPFFYQCSVMCLGGTQLFVDGIQKHIWVLPAKTGQNWFLKNRTFTLRFMTSGTFLPLRNHA
jgi:hypothetical protein